MLSEAVVMTNDELASTGRSSWAFAAMAGSVGGAALQLQQPALWGWFVYAGALGIAVVGVWALRRVARDFRVRAAALTLALLVGALGGGGLTGWRACVYAADALTPALEGRDLQLVGVVAQMPQRNEVAQRFSFDVESARWADAPTGRLTGKRARVKANAPDAPSTSNTPESTPPQVPPRISLGWYNANVGFGGRTAGPARGEAARSPELLHAGERWRLTVRLKAPHGTLNPHGFDYELWMWEQGLQATGYVRAGARDAWPERLASTWRHPVERAREAVRDAAFERIADRKLAGVIAALVTGDQSAIDRGDWDIFRATGVAHLMSISGLHVTMFAWIAALAVGALWRRSTRLMLRWPAPHAALVGGVLLAALYALFSGWGVPSQRTIWMLSSIALLRLTGQRWPWPHVWLLACAVVVAFDPWALMQPGFWLSFVAVGVLFATDSGASTVRATGVAGRLLQNFREQWVITLALTPLTLLLFQQVSVVGLLANAVAIPWVTLVVTPLAMGGVILPPLWHAAAWSVQGLTVLLQWLAQLPFATLSMPAPALWAAAAGVAGGVLLAMRLPWSVRLLGVPLLLPVLLWQAPRPLAGEFELLAADVGQGNAVLVRTATHSLLYDAGPRYSQTSDAGQRVVVPLLRAFGERLNAVMLSHRDSDHAGGVVAVLAMQPQARLISSIETGHPLQQQRPVQRCVAGQRWDWDGVGFEVLHPLASDYTADAKPNALSCVLRIGNGRASALLVGDIERPQEAALVGRYRPLLTTAAEAPQPTAGAPSEASFNVDGEHSGTAPLRADVLLVPHHGSKTSSSAPWLDAVKPRVALIQAGYRNRYGHPAESVLQRYRERDIALADSAHCGAIGWRSGAPGSWTCEREVARRYWHHRVP